VLIPIKKPPEGGANSSRIVAISDEQVEQVEVVD
jgi:hypothetical protein